METVGQLLRKGEIDKEVYGLSRLQDEESDEAKSPKGDPHALALHFDLTVPFARYVVENAGYLAFPFRRYQIQKVWRGERPQEGRAREFTQADIDIVGDGELPFRYDVEIALVIAEALGALPIPDFLLRINNRKLAEGFYNGIGLRTPPACCAASTSSRRSGPPRSPGCCKSELGATEDQAEAALKLAVDPHRRTRPSWSRSGRWASAMSCWRKASTSWSRSLRPPSSTPPDGWSRTSASPAAWTTTPGTVVETVLVGHEQLGSICSGGRYDALASKGNRTFPGVGLSIGVTRLVSRILSQDLAKATRSVPTAVLVTLNNDDSWGAAQDVAAQLRSRGIATEVAAKAEKFGKQIKFADRRGIPFVWFTDDDGKHQVKDIRSGEQADADPASWAPAEEDLHVRVTKA